jgi:hypothetical protein
MPGRGLPHRANPPGPPFLYLRWRLLGRWIGARPVGRDSSPSSCGSLGRSAGFGLPGSVSPTRSQLGALAGRWARSAVDPGSHSGLLARHGGAQCYMLVDGVAHSGCQCLGVRLGVLWWRGHDSLIHTSRSANDESRWPRAEDWTELLHCREGRWKVAENDTAGPRGPDAQHRRRSRWRPRRESACGPWRLGSEPQNGPVLETAASTPPIHASASAPPSPSH